MKLLNLDDVGSVKRKVQLFGKEFELAEKTVGQMIESLQYIEKSGEHDEVEVFRTMVRMAQELLPDASEQEIRRLSIPQLRALIEFANASDSEVVEGSEKAEEDGKKLKAK